jgi:hypothetical protein
MTQDNAAELGKRAVRFWRLRGTERVGYEVYHVALGVWSYRLTGIGPRGLPVEWVGKRNAG